MSDPQVTLSRAFDAPRELVFEIWTKPEHVSQWWGCDSLVNIVCDIDLRVGGTYRLVNRDASGREHPFIGEYREIVAGERLVYTQAYDVAPWSEQAAEVTVTFSEAGGQTIVTAHLVRSGGSEFSPAVRNGMEAALGSSIDRMKSYIASLT